jgi:signal peptidase I
MHIPSVSTAAWRRISVKRPPLAKLATLAGFPARLSTASWRRICVERPRVTALAAIAAFPAGLSAAGWRWILVRRPRPRSVLAFGLTAVAIVAWILLLRPQSLGGSVSYDLIRGNSMVPTLHSNDLVLARNQSSYEVGDIITFRTEAGNVIHRIVGGSAQEGFITQGDNAEVTDLWRPKPDDILGKMWIGIPNGGKVIETIRSPLVLAALIAALGVFVVLGIGDKTKKRGNESGEPPA